jgi:hypothetical protein
VQYAEGGERESELNITNFIKVASFDGSSQFIPTSGTYDNFVSAKDVHPPVFTYLDSPIAQEKLGVVIGTVSFEKDPLDRLFEIKPVDGSEIIDRIKNLHYEVGQNLSPPPVSRAEAEKQVRSELDRADRQRDELKAGSRERNGNDWFTWAPWGLALMASLFCVILIYRSRRGS